MSLYLLDTNTVTHVVKGHPAVDRRIIQIPISDLRLSSITAGEVYFGRARRPEARGLRRTVQELLLRIEIAPWDDEVARTYGVLRAGLQSGGGSLSSLDMLIAAHALTLEAVLVTSDRAFSRVPDLTIEDWSV